MEGTMVFGEKDGAGYFVHVFDPDLEGTRVPKDFVFVLDNSGSMGGTKLAQAKEALTSIYGRLYREDRFSFVRFSTIAINWKDNLVKANDNNKEDVLDHISDIVVEGGTNIHEGVIAALDIFKNDGDAVPVIVLLTDGKANVGLYDRSEFRKDVALKNTVDASIFCIALGNSADWPFLEALALENNGKAIWVKEDVDPKDSIKDFTKSFSTPLVADLSFDYGSDVTDVYPTSFPAHYKGSEVLLAGRYPIWQDQISLVVSGRSGDGKIVKRTTISIDGAEKQDFVPRFWAFQRIQYLLGHMKYNGTDNASVDEIIELALDFQFVTDYTSLFVELPFETQESTPEQPSYNDYPSYGGPKSEDSADMAPGFAGFEVLLAFIAIVSIGWTIRRSRR